MSAWAEVAYLIAMVERGRGMTGGAWRYLQDLLSEDDAECAPVRELQALLEKAYVSAEFKSMTKNLTN